MSRLKNSLIASVGLLVIIGVIAVLTPRTGQSQTDPVGPAKPVVVTNSPSEPVPVTGTVNVGNLGNSPLPVRDVDNGQQPLQMTRAFSLSSGNSGSSTKLFTVPTGKRFIIETVSVRSEQALVDTPDRVAVIMRLGDEFVFNQILLLRQGQNLNGEAVFVGTHYMRGYSDPGTDVEFQFSRSNTTNSASAEVSISGYFVDVP